MATNRHRKNHKQKVQARKNRIDNEKKQAQKSQREFIMNLIKQEQEKGMYDNTTSIITPEVLTNPIIEGPSF